MAQLKQYGLACEKASGDILPFVGTVDVAWDMERLREALGDTGLIYMGQSYGSLLGLTYASMFPSHVRAMVLDSVIDPAISYDQFTQEQADGFERMLDVFFRGAPEHPLALGDQPEIPPQPFSQRSRPP